MSINLVLETSDNLETIQQCANNLKTISQQRLTDTEAYTLAKFLMANNDAIWAYKNIHPEVFLSALINSVYQSELLSVLSVTQEHIDNGTLDQMLGVN